MVSIEEAVALAEAGFNVQIKAGGVVAILTDEEVAKIIAEAE